MLHRIDPHVLMAEKGQVLRLARELAQDSTLSSVDHLAPDQYLELLYLLDRAA